MSMFIDDIVDRHPSVTAEALKEYYGYYYDLLEITDYEEILNTRVVFRSPKQPKTTRNNQT